MTDAHTIDAAREDWCDYVARYPRDVWLAIVADETTVTADLLDPMLRRFSQPGLMTIRINTQNGVGATVLGGRLHVITYRHGHNRYAVVRGLTPRGVWLDRRFVDRTGRLFDVLGPCMTAKDTRVFYGSLHQLLRAGSEQAVHVGPSKPIRQVRG